MRKDHYRTLRVPRNETVRGIRSAYRRLARECHPDCAGARGEPRFKEITEAFEVLSDERRRGAHDRELAGESPTSAPDSTPRRPPMPGPEPLIPPRRPLASAAGVRPGLEPLVERWRRNFTGLGSPKSKRIEPLSLEVVLERDEALRGGWIPLEFPAFERCPGCAGTGRDLLFPCPICDRQGLVEVRRRVDVRVPPGVASGTLLDLPLAGLGVHNFLLRLYVVIDG